MFQTLLGLRRRGEGVQPPLTSLSAMTNVPVYAGASMPFPAWPFATTVPADTICFTPSEEHTRCRFNIAHGNDRKCEGN